MNDDVFGPVTKELSSQGRFPKDQQLDDSLIIVDKKICRKFRSAKTRAGNDDTPNLPGYPTRSLRSSIEDVRDLELFIYDEFITPKLNRMAPHLWLVSTPIHSSISPLHEQVVRGRRVVITENPELHLVWIDDRVFIKPIPSYLMSHAVWEKYLDVITQSPFQDHVLESIQPAILGFLRSWTYLVRYESDFNIAKQAGLIPHGVQYPRFVKFIANFGSNTVQDDDVSARYRFGQLRLSRLNIWAKVFLRQWEFETVYWQYWQYFQTFYGPLLFIFGVLTVILSAMQVGLTAPGIWPAFSHVSVWFSVTTLLVVAIVGVALAALFLSMGLKEFIFATKALLRKRLS